MTLTALLVILESSPSQYRNVTSTEIRSYRCATPGIFLNFFPLREEPAQPQPLPERQTPREFLKLRMGCIIVHVSQPRRAMRYQHIVAQPGEDRIGQNVKTLVMRGNSYHVTESTRAWWICELANIGLSSRSEGWFAVGISLCKGSFHILTNLSI